MNNNKNFKINFKISVDTKQYLCQYIIKKGKTKHLPFSKIQIIKIIKRGDLYV